MEEKQAVERRVLKHYHPVGRDDLQEDLPPLYVQDPSDVAKPWPVSAILLARYPRCHNLRLKCAIRMVW